MANSPLPTTTYNNIFKEKNSTILSKMKCELCNQKIETTFLSKIIGTVIKDENGKKHFICGNCQNKFENEKDKMIKELGKE